MVKKSRQSQKTYHIGFTLTSHIWKRIWRAQALTYVVGFLLPAHGIYQLETKENSMETQKEVRDSQVITEQNGSKTYWVLMIIGLLVYVISFLGSGSDFFSALGVLVGAFVVSRLLTYFYFKVVKGKSKRQQSITQAVVFLVMSVIFLIVAMNK